MTVANEMSYQLDSPQVDLNCDRVVFFTTAPGEVGKVIAPNGYSVTRTSADEYTLNIPKNAGDCMVVASSDQAGSLLFGVDYTDSKEGTVIIDASSGGALSATISLLVFVERSSES